MQPEDVVESAEPIETPSDPVRRRSTLVSALDWALREAVGAGDRAALRRLDPEEPGCPAFYRIAASHLAPAGELPEGGEALDEAERRWAAILTGLALCGHDPHRRLGEGLATAGLSELRLNRLLRAHGKALRQAVVSAARFLSAKGIAANWAEMAELVLSDGKDWEEPVRRRIARSYFAAVSNSNREEEG